MVPRVDPTYRRPTRSPRWLRHAQRGVFNNARVDGRVERSGRPLHDQHGGVVGAEEASDHL
jgi:hypothetical protein